MAVNIEESESQVRGCPSCICACFGFTDDSGDPLSWSRSDKRGKWPAETIQMIVDGLDEPLDPEAYISGEVTAFDPFNTEELSCDVCEQRCTDGCATLEFLIEVYTPEADSE